MPAPLIREDDSRPITTKNEAKMPRSTVAIPMPWLLSEDRKLIIKNNQFFPKAVQEQKFFFPQFYEPVVVKKATETTFYAEKINNHCVLEPHHGHKHYHRHEYHHEPNHHDNDNVACCTDRTCGERDEDFDSSLNHADDISLVMKAAKDDIIVNEAPLHTTKLRVQNICCPKEAKIIQEELGESMDCDHLRVASKY